MTLQCVYIYNEQYRLFVYLNKHLLAQNFVFYLNETELLVL